MADAGSERRQYERIDQPFIVNFRIRQEGDSKTQQVWNMVTIRNLSAGGVCFNYHEKMVLGMILEFNITLPFSSSSIRCLGEVYRIDEGLTCRLEEREVPIYGIVARFVEIESDKKEAINRIVKEFRSR